MNELEPILLYSMNDIEAKAFKIGLIWHDEYQSNLPGENHETFRRGKDPRKTNLFKHCYKLAREIAGIVPDNETHLYVRAQIQVLKSIRQGKVHALISPHCLVGDKAWSRWKLWKRIYEKCLSKNPTSEEIGVKIKESVVKNEINRTFSFLDSKGLIGARDYSNCKEDIARWISTGEISPFYVMLSPMIRRSFPKEEMSVDSSLYRPHITPSSELFFRERFSHEFR